MASEFHDLAEQALNHESNGASCWGNLGYWQAPQTDPLIGQTYPQAAAALADQLALALELNEETRLLDVGFGCGDQLLHWIEHYGVRQIYGLNLSKSQTELAKQRLANAGLHDTAQQLHQGDASRLRRWASTHLHEQPNAIAALDCAYHFGSRRQFVQDAAALLAPGGQLGVTDLVLAQSPLRLREQLPLRAIAHLSHIPWANLQSLDDYQSEWSAAGFEITQCIDLTEHVFLPFGNWLTRYQASLDADLAKSINWTKYKATARFLRWAAQNQVLRYVLCTGRI